MISSHILDTSLGLPASNVLISLSRKTDKGWEDLAKAHTNSDGRVSFDIELKNGVYKLKFAIEDYYKKLGQKHFFLNTKLVFNVDDTERKYHVPLLLNPFGYSTYRGS